MSFFKLLLVGATLILSAALLTACGNEVTHLTVEGTDNLTFTPDTLTVKPGQTVELTLVNNGKLPHTFTIPEFNIEVQMPLWQPTMPKSRVRGVVGVSQHSR